MKDVIDDLVEELPVVADQQQRVAIAAQKLAEPQRRFEIEMVGRLVEQQQVGLGEEHAGKRDAHAPAAREIRQRLLLHRVVEAEPGEDAGGARWRAECAPIAASRSWISATRRGIGAVLGLGEEALRARHRRRARLAAASSSPLGASCARKPMRASRGSSMLPPSGCTLAADQIEQRRFAGAVAADQPDLPAIGESAPTRRRSASARQCDRSCPKWSAWKRVLAQTMSW